MKDNENIGTAIVVLNKNNQILLGKRLNSYKAGTYGMPGGHTQIMESVFVSASRELKEETGLSNKLKFLGVVINSRREDFTFVHVVFLCEGVVEKPVNVEPDKCEGWHWYSFDKLPENILPGHKAAIDLYLSKKKMVELTEL